MTNFPASAAYTPLTYLAYGDSITIATNGAVTYPNNSYVARIAAQLGIPGGSVTNQAVSGAMAGDVMSLQVLPNDAPAETAQQPLRTLLISTNEASIKGAGAYEATFNTIDQAILAWESIAAPYKVMGSTVVGSTTGTCAQDNTYANALGVLCTSNAATAPFSITTTGGPIYIWYRCIDSDAGTWTYAIDGGSTVAVTTALTTAIATTNGTTASVCLIRVPASAAAHTLSFVKTSTGGNMGIIGVGTVSNSLVNSQPYIIAGDTPSELNGAAASAVAAYRADIVANVALLAGDGLNIQLKYISKYLIATTAASDMFNTLHPNDQGHGEMAAAFLGGSGLFPATSGASPYYNAQNASYVPGAGNQVVSIAATSGTVTLNVQASGTVYWIVNRSSSTNLTLAAGSGVTINGAATIPPLGVAVAISTGSSWAIGPASNAITTLYQGPSAGYTIAPGNQVTAMNCIANCTLAIGTGTYGQVEYVANRSATYTVTVSGTISSGPTSIPPLGGAIYVSSNSAWWGVAVGAQNGIYTPNGTPTYTAGTNVTSVGCASGYTCTNTRGELTIVGGTATTGTIATLNFSATLTAAPGLCIVTQAGGASLFGIGHGTPATTGFTITAGVSVATSTVTVDYSCQP
jgi:lysophospholipase L1-like esterase